MIRRKIKTFSVSTHHHKLVEVNFDEKVDKWLNDNPDVEILEMRSSATEDIFVLHILYN